MATTLRTVVAVLICIGVLSVPDVSAQIASGIWIDKNEIGSLPMSGSAWSGLKAAADRSCGTPNLENQEDPANVCVMAKALVYARTGTSSYAAGVVTALRAVVNSGTYGGRALALGRELVAYVIAADLIDLETYDPSLDQSFRSKIRSLSTASTTEAGTIIQCHENRPNNWGTHCGASRAAVAAYLGDTAQLARIAQVFKGWLGDRSSYAGFNYGDLSWQYNSSTPVGVNQTGASKSGHNIDGVLPDDQRRGGGFTWPPPQENYVWEALQGAFAEAVILDRAGYDVFNWQDRALLRAVRWLHEQAGFPAEGDDTWLPHIVNHFYGTSFPAPSPSSPGKNAGWTDWTHSGATSSCSYSLSPTSASLPAVGGGTQATVTTGSSCSWTAGSNVSWVTLNTSGRTGSGTVIATVAANSGTAARTGTLTIAGRTFTITQQGGTTPPATPAAPASPAPASGATSVSTATTLRWTCSGASSYTVRLGTSNPPPQAATGVATTSYTPALAAGRTYYWQVVGVSSSGSTSGPVWSFSTATSTPPPPPPPPSTSLPSPWIGRDVGSVGLAGSATYSSGSYTVAAAGADIWGTADSFYYAYQPLTGKTTIIARVTAIQNTDSLAKAGIMMRQGPGAGDAHVVLDVRPNGTVELMTRSSTGGTTRFVAGATQAAPCWLRLVRNSTTVTASVSSNGSTWKTVGSVSMALTSKALVGLVVASHSTTQRNTSKFDNVTVR